MLDNPIGVAVGDAASAVSLVAHFSDVQRHFDGLDEQYAALIAALRDAWPGAWSGTSRETDLRQHINDFERVANSMRISPDLTLVNLAEGNEFLFNIISMLEALLDAARARDPGDHTRDGAGGGRTAPPPDEKEIALRYFGFSTIAPPTSKQELRDAWATRIKTLHPDAHPGATDEEIARLNERFRECNRFYGMLLAYFSWC
jgi:hypothetical protein